MLPRPRVRLPLWSVPLIVIAIYVVRSLVRGSWRLDLPMDAVVLALVVVVVFVVARLREIAAETEEPDRDRGISPQDGDDPAVSDSESVLGD